VWEFSGDSLDLEGNIHRQLDQAYNIPRYYKENAGSAAAQKALAKRGLKSGYTEVFDLTPTRVANAYRGPNTNPTPVDLITQLVEAEANKYAGISIVHTPNARANANGAANARNGHRATSPVLTVACETGSTIHPTCKRCGDP